MKKIILAIFSVFAISSIANAQSTTQLSSPVGIGIGTATADLHIHESVFTEPQQEPDPGIDPPRESWPGDYYTTLRLTNTTTSSSDNDGFVIEQMNNTVSLRQLENSNFNIYGYSGLGIEINKNGKIGIGDTSRPEYKVNVGGNTHIKGNIYVDTKVVSGYGEFSESVLIAGMAKVGTGFECSQAGQVKAKSIKVTLDGWSDFVFDEDYRLPSLYELEKYVATNRHLPDIPSAKEVEENGVDLGEMNAKLLQKVEELTLYVIDLQKQINELKNK